MGCIGQMIRALGTLCVFSGLLCCVGGMLDAGAPDELLTMGVVLFLSGTFIRMVFKPKGASRGSRRTPPPRRRRGGGGTKWLSINDIMKGNW